VAPSLIFSAAWASDLSARTTARQFQSLTRAVSVSNAIIFVLFAAEVQAKRSPVFPFRRAFFHQGPQALLRILEIGKLVEENLHRIPDAIAER
jgi:hypothetical protein